MALMETGLTMFSEDLSDAIDGAPGDSLADDLKFMLQMGLMSHMRRPNLMQRLEGEFQRLEEHIDTTSSHGAVREAMIRLLERYRDPPPPPPPPHSPKGGGPPRGHHGPGRGRHRQGADGRRRRAAGDRLGSGDRPHGAGDDRVPRGGVGRGGVTLSLPPPRAAWRE